MTEDGSPPITAVKAPTGGWFPVENDFIESGRMASIAAKGGSVLAVWFVLKKLQGNNPSSWASLKKLADKARIGRRQAIRAIDQLGTMGELEIISHGRGAKSTNRLRLISSFAERPMAAAKWLRERSGRQTAWKAAKEKREHCRNGDTAGTFKNHRMVTGKSPIGDTGVTGLVTQESEYGDTAGTQQTPRQRTEKNTIQKHHDDARASSLASQEEKHDGDDRATSSPSGLIQPEQSSPPDPDVLHELLIAGVKESTARDLLVGEPKLPKVTVSMVRIYMHRMAGAYSLSTIATNLKNSIRSRLPDLHFPIGKMEFERLLPEIELVCGYKITSQPRFEPGRMILSVNGGEKRVYFTSLRHENIVFKPRTTAATESLPERPAAPVAQKVTSIIPSPRPLPGMRYNATSHEYAAPTILSAYPVQPSNAVEKHAAIDAIDNALDRLKSLGPTTPDGKPWSAWLFDQVEEFSAGRKKAIARMLHLAKKTPSAVQWFAEIRYEPPIIQQPGSVVTLSPAALQSPNEAPNGTEKPMIASSKNPSAMESIDRYQEAT